MRERGRARRKERDTEKEGEREGETGRKRARGREADRERDRERGRERDTERERPRGRETRGERDSSRVRKQGDGGRESSPSTTLKRCEAVPKKIPRSLRALPLRRCVRRQVRSPHTTVKKQGGVAGRGLRTAVSTT